MSENTSIDIIVQSKYPTVLKEFRDGFDRTTKKFHNLVLHVIDGEEYGAKPINHLIEEVIKKKSDYIGIFNDDIWFVPGWLEDCLDFLQSFDCVSPGYVETNSKEHFLKVAIATQKEDGFILNLYGAIYLFKVSLFKDIGIFDERFEWSCNDLDWEWRLKLNGKTSVTSKKITVAHRGWVSLPKSKERNVVGLRNKEEFYKKHGYYSYDKLKESYNPHYEYFKPFSKYV